MSPVAKIYEGGQWVPVGSGPTVVQNAGRLGDVSWWPFATLPDDAVACEGQQITVGAWPELHAFLVANGNPFGTAGGNPLMLDMRGLFPVGQDATQIEFDTLLEIGGAKNVTLTAAQSGSPGHKHTINDSVSRAAVGAVNANTSHIGIQAGTVLQHGPSITAYTHSAPYVAGTFNWSHHALIYGETNGPVASGAGLNASQAHPNLPPYRVGRWIMRARTVFQGLGSQFATEQYVQEQERLMQVLATPAAISASGGKTVAVTGTGTVTLPIDPPVGTAYEILNLNGTARLTLAAGAGQNIRQQTPIAGVASMFVNPGDPLEVIYMGSGEWRVKRLPEFGARMYLASNFVLAASTNVQVGAGGSYWTVESDTSPNANMAIVGSNPRFNIPVSGYYSGRLQLMYASTGTDLSLLAWLTTVNGQYAAASGIAFGNAEQGFGFNGVTVEAPFEHVFLAAGTQVYPNTGWVYGGAGNHTILGTSGSTGNADVTYMEMRYEGQG